MHHRRIFGKLAIMDKVGGKKLDKENKFLQQEHSSGSSIDSDHRNMRMWTVLLNSTRAGHPSPEKSICIQLVFRVC